MQPYCKTAILWLVQIYQLKTINLLKDYLNLTKSAKIFGVDYIVSTAEFITNKKKKKEKGNDDRDKFQEYEQLSWFDPQAFYFYLYTKNDFI